MEDYYFQKKKAMRVNDFEKAIGKIGLEPKEVRLENNHVKWFLCGGNSDYDIIVFDANGKALVLSTFFWPEEVNDIKIEVYRDKNGQVLGMTVNGVPVMRDSRLDLNFEEEDKPVPGLYVEETACPYPERTTCDGCPMNIEEEGICDMEIPQVLM